MSKPAQAKYHTTNWIQYSAALKRRASLIVWLDADLQWQASPTGRNGRPAVFSDAAIQFCLTLKCKLGLGLRQATRLGESLLRLAMAGGRLQHPVPASEDLERGHIGDAPMLRKLLAQNPVGEPVHSVSADGAYDTNACREAIGGRQAAAIIPTRRSAKPWGDARAGAQARNEILRTTQNWASHLEERKPRPRRRWPPAR